MCELEQWIEGINWLPLLTLGVGAYAVYIARQQWKTAASKIKLDLFERRYRVFEEVRKLRNLSYPSVRLQKSDIEAFKAMTVEAEFLFGTDIHEYLREISECANDLENLNWKLNSPGIDTTNRIEIVASWRSKVEELKNRFDEAGNEFKNYLDFSKL